MEDEAGKLIDERDELPDFCTRIIGYFALNLILTAISFLSAIAIYLK